MVAQWYAPATELSVRGSGVPLRGSRERRIHSEGLVSLFDIAVVRGEKPIITQSPDFRLVPADTLVLVGSHASVD